MSWASKRDADGVRIDAHGAPPGEWRMKLSGQDRSKYHFITRGFMDEENHAGKIFFMDSWLNGELEFFYFCLVIIMD